MKLFVFGNIDDDTDNLAPMVGDNLKNFPELEIINIGPNDDLPIFDTINILDTVLGIDQVTLITEKGLDKFVLSPRNTAHDYDLGFQLRYLTKIGKLKKVNIIGLPIAKKPDYDLVNSILRKLVAQDMQGS